MSEEEFEEGDITQPTRQSPLGVVVYMIRNFRNMITALVSILIVGAANPKVWIWLGVSFIPVLFVTMYLAYLQYKNFTFQVSDEELIVHRGVLFKDRMVIPAHRIQTIQITQNLLQRILGLVGLQVDTAGSKGSELRIPALERKLAVQLQELLYLKKEEILAHRRGEQNLGAEAQPTPAARADKRAEDKVLVKLGVGDLFVVGLTENHLKTGLLALAVAFGYINQYIEFLESYLTDYVETYTEEVVNAGLTMILSAVIVFIALSVIISLVRTVLRFANFRAVLQVDAVRISGGLVKRNENRIPIKKIQFIEWHTNPLRKLVGFESAKLRPSGAVDSSQGRQLIEIPALKKAQSLLLAESSFANFHVPDTRVDANAWGYARLYTIIATLVCTPIAVGLFFAVEWYALLIYVVVAVVGAIGLRYGKSVNLRLNEHFILIFRGWIFPVRVAIPAYKVQAVSLHQSFFLVRRGLCHLRIHTSGGASTVRYLTEAQALEIKNFLLYLSERHRGSWM